MKKWFGCLLLSSICWLSVHGQPYTLIDIKKQISSVYKIGKLPNDAPTFHLILYQDTLPAKHPLAPLVNNHVDYLAYLVSNYSTVKFDQLLSSGLSLEKANALCSEQLLNDRLFTQCFVEVATYYLQSTGATVVGGSTAKKPTITMPSLLRMAANFFTNLEAGDDCRVIWHLNLPLNPYFDKKQVTNQPLIEAFCRETILNWSATGAFYTLRYDKAFCDEVKGLTARMASLDSPEDKRQVVPAMRELMSRSSVLEKVLLEAYQHSETWLGFTLIH